MVTAVRTMGNTTISPDRVPESAARISICIIARNEAATIGALVRQLAAQTIFSGFDDVDLLVVSNGSDDGTAASAERAIALSFGDRALRARVHDTPLGGKARSWNLAVHDLLDPDREIVVFLDADISLAHDRVLGDLVSRLLQDQQLLAVSGYPLKDTSRKANKTLVDRFSLKISSQTPAPHAINGSLYAARMSELLKIWLPVPTPGEDGALTAMIHTDGFSSPPRPDFVARMTEPTHYFEAHSVSGFFQHERRMTVGTTINGWIFEHLWAGNHDRHVGTIIRAWNEDDPRWIDRLVAQKTAGRIWALPPRMLSWRLHNLKGAGFRKAIARAPFSVAATLLNLWPCVQANRMIKRQGAAGYW